MKTFYLIIISFLFITACHFAQVTTIKLPTTDNTSSFNITNSSNAVRLKINADGGFYLGGTYGSGSIPIEGSGTRLMWYPGKSAFRAGGALATEWDDSTIGRYSAAIGWNAKASGSNSIALGSGIKASGDYSVALGSNTTANGVTSIAMGLGATASSFYTTAMGFYTTASGESSTAIGNSTMASGYFSTAMGYHTTAQAYNSLVLGMWNIISGSQYGWFPTDPALVVGNGTGTATRSNALTLFKNGNMTIAGTLTESSDKRLKENITPLNNVLWSFEKITPVYYNFIDKQSHPSSRQIGLLAQEIEPLFPELITKDSQGYLSLDYSKLTAILMKAIKEQQEIITEKNNELKKVENKVAELETNLSEQNNRISAQQVIIEKLVNEYNTIVEVLNDQSRKDKEVKANFTLNK